jgi:hypothetical protein
MTDPIEAIEPPPYGDLYLRFTDEAEATAALEDYPGAVDVIGIIYQSTGEDTPPVALDGWHVNTRGPMLESLIPYAVHPEHPVRVWA